MIRKGILKAFDGDTYKASVQVIGSLSVWLDNVTVSAALNRADMVAGRSVVLLSLDPSNPDDCILVGLWGVPQEPPAPGAHENTHTDGASDEIDSALDPRAYPLLADILANRPAAGVDGRFFWTTDEHILYRDNGTNWVKAAVADHADLDGVGASDHHAQFENVVEDTTPQLGGDLDAQNHDLNNVGTLNVTHISAAGGGYDFDLQSLYYFHLLHNGSIIFNVTPMDVVGIRSVGWIPLLDDTYDLGQTGAGPLQKRWRDLYLSGSIIGTSSPDETLKLDAAAGIFYVDDIQEITPNAGVTIEGVLIKDSEVDGVDIASHVSRHEVGGDDPLLVTAIYDPTDQDTIIEAEEDQVTMDVGGVEAFKLDVDGILTLAKQARCFAYLGANQNIAGDAAWHEVDLNSELYDEQSEFNTTGHKFEPAVDGYYFISVIALFIQTTNDKYYYAGIFKNGALCHSGGFHASNAGLYISPQVSTVLYLQTTDDIEFYVAHNSGVQRTLFGSNQSTFMVVHRLS
jgi:hypothetical protein